MEKTAPPPPNVILSDDILLEILSRLPLQHLLRFKKVSPSFSRLTSEAYWLRQKIPSSSSSSSSLIVQDRCHENNVVHLDLCRRNDSAAAAAAAAAAVVIADTVLLPPSQYPTNLALLATCNGLLLYRDLVERVYCVSNPVTRQWFRLPLNTPKGLNLVACIDFDPQVSPHFKVAQFIHVPRVSLYLAVFDSRSKTICDVVEMNHQLVEVDLLRRRHCCVLLGNVLYVLGTLTKILRVDVRARSCLALKLPVRWTEQSPDTARMTLHKCEGGRVRFAYHQQNEFEQIRMWMLEDQDGVGHETTRWIPMFKCSYRFLDEQIRGQLPGHYLDSVLDIALGPDVVVFFSAKTGRGRGTGRYSTVLVPYCFRTKTVLTMSPLRVFAKRIFAF